MALHPFNSPDRKPRRDLPNRRPLDLNPQASMSPHQPEGQAWDEYGRLRAELAEACAKRPLAIYVHVPFCQIRCGYCDFNTYTVGFGPGADRES